MFYKLISSLKNHVMGNLLCSLALGAIFSLKHFVSSNMILMEPQLKNCTSPIVFDVICCAPKHHLPIK
jgi:hypothetical protein